MVDIRFGQSDVPMEKVVAAARKRAAMTSL